MEFRTLDVTLISANDLKDVNVFSKMDVYAVVSLNNDPRTRHKTHVDKDSGTSPRWNFPAKFSLDEPSLQASRLFLQIKIVSDRKLGDKDIGEVHVPLKELLDTADKSGPKTASYAVRLQSGKSKGNLEFSYAFGEKYTVEAPQPPPPPMMQQQQQQPKKLGDEPVTAYPAANGVGSSSAYPPGYGQAPPQQGYAAYPPQGYGPPPQAYPYGYGAYPPPPQGSYVAYPPPPQGPYGAYPPQQAYPYGYQKPQKKKNGNMGLGIAGGLLGGLLIGDMISDVGDAAAYDAGFEDGMDF